MAETPAIAALLGSAVEEVARLLHADGAMLYLVDDASGVLRLAHQAGVADRRQRTMLGRLRLHIGDGVFGLAVAEGRSVLTGDYANDRQFVHAAPQDRFVDLSGLRSMVVAPLVHDGTSFGGLGAFARRLDAFGASDRALVRALADHAAASIANALLIDRLATSEREIARRADIERALREIGSRLAAIREPSDLLQRVVDESARLLQADGARIELLDEATGRLRWAFDSRTGRQPGMGPIAEDVRGRAGGTRDEGVSGHAFRENRAVSTGDYLRDTQFRHLPGADRQVRRHGLRSAVAAPLPGEEGPMGTLTVYAIEPDAYGADDIAVVVALADQAGVVLANARRMSAIERSREEIARLAESERALREIAARITAIRDPSAVLDQIVTEAARLLAAERAQIDLLTPVDERLRWSYPSPLDAATTAAAGIPAPRGGRIRGLAGRAMAESRVVATGDYLRDRSFGHVRSTDEGVRAEGLRSVVAAPLSTEGETLGVLQLGSVRPDAFGDRAQALVEALAIQASIAIANSRRTAELARSRAALTRKAASEQALRELAARLTAMRDPADVLQHAVNEAVRVLGADAALIDLLETGEGLEGAYDSGLAGVIDDQSLREQTVRAGEGLSGRAIAERHALQTGDYLADRSFRHTRVSDRFVRRARLRSMIAAPLLSDGGAFGTLEVFARARDAFGDDEMAVATALANQASIALTNARLIADLAASRLDLEELLARVRDSEGRYRFLTEHSPDIVFSTAADGRITYMSESVERITGWSPETVVGRSFTELVAPDDLPVTARLFVELAVDPSVPLRAEIGIVGPDGRRIPIELNSQAHVHAGRVHSFTNVAREIGERLRFQEELREQAAALAASEERAHLARELHDSVTQALFSMTLVTRSLELLLDRDPAAALEKVADLRTLQRDALAEMRALVFELRPDSLTRDGLAVALRTHAAAVGARAGISVAVDASAIERMPMPVEEALFRIAQESLHNVIKHAAAEHAWITVTASAGRCFMVTADDGRGFEPAAVPPGHLGLTGMATRAERLGGSLSVDSHPGGGTRISVELPVAEADIVN